MSLAAEMSRHEHLSQAQCALVCGVLDSQEPVHEDAARLIQVIEAKHACRRQCARASGDAHSLAPLGGLHAHTGAAETWHLELVY